MESPKFDALVIGGGPGGYAAAIRLSQLGLRSAIVERTRLGGVCLNVGCIPSKALISASKLADKMARADAIGLRAGPVEVDMGKMQQWKSGVVDKLAGGVTQLCRGNNVDVIQGSARFRNNREVEISDGTVAMSASLQLEDRSGSQSSTFEKTISVTPNSRCGY